MSGAMKIERVRTYHLRVELSPAEAFAFSQAHVRARSAMLVEVVADDGRSGWGEAYGPPAPSKTIIDELYAPRVIGRDPTGRRIPSASTWPSSRSSAPVLPSTSLSGPGSVSRWIAPCWSATR